MLRTQWLLAVHHDRDELLLRDLSVPVHVKLVDHRLPAVSFAMVIPAHSSSSPICSPSSFATRRRLRSEMRPDLSSSKSANARRSSSSGSRARIFSVTVGEMSVAVRRACQPSGRQSAAACAPISTSYGPSACPGRTIARRRRNRVSPDRHPLLRRPRVERVCSRSRHTAHGMKRFGHAPEFTL